MASVIDDPAGKRRISFVGPQGRKTIYLGKTSRKAADSVNLRVEAILAANEQGQALDLETAGWLARLPDTFHKKLSDNGLVAARDRRPVAEPTTLGAFTEQYIEARTDVKPGTRTNLRQTRRQLLQFFGSKGAVLSAEEVDKAIAIGAKKPLADVTPGDADQYRQDLLSRLGENTARRHCGRAKQFFRAALRKRLIVENPFADMKGCAVRANPSRFYFIGREDAQKVIDACPDAQWRLIFALSRYGGLLPERASCPPLGRRGLGAKPDHGPQSQDGEIRRRGLPADTALPRVAAVPGRGFRASRAGDGVCHHPLPQQQREPANAIGADHGTCRREAVAQALPESPLHAGDGACPELPDPRRLCLVGQFPARGAEALLAGSGRGFRPGRRPQRRMQRTSGRIGSAERSAASVRRFSPAVPRNAQSPA